MNPRTRPSAFSCTRFVPSEEPRREDSLRRGPRTGWLRSLWLGGGFPNSRLAEGGLLEELLANLEALRLATPQQPELRGRFGSAFAIGP